jgi:hypothetical protein
MSAPGSSCTSCAARAIASPIRMPGVSTTSAPRCRSSATRSFDIVSGMVRISRYRGSPPQRRDRCRCSRPWPRPASCRAQDTPALRILDQRHAQAILHAAARIVHLELGHDATGARARGVRVRPRRPTDVALTSRRIMARSRSVLTRVAVRMEAAGSDRQREEPPLIQTTFRLGSPIRRKPAGRRAGRRSCSRARRTPRPGHHEQDRTLARRRETDQAA